MSGTHLGILLGAGFGQGGLTAGTTFFLGLTIGGTIGLLLGFECRSGSFHGFEFLAGGLAFGFTGGLAFETLAFLCLGSGFALRVTLGFEASTFGGLFSSSLLLGKAGGFLLCYGFDLRFGSSELGGVTIGQKTGLLSRLFCSGKVTGEFAFPPQ